MRRVCIVDLEAGSQCALSEGVWVVAEEGIVVAQKGVVDGAVWVCQQQILVLAYYLMERKAQRVQRVLVSGSFKVSISIRKQSKQFAVVPC